MLHFPFELGIDAHYESYEEAIVSLEIPHMIVRWMILRFPHSLYCDFPAPLASLPSSRSPALLASHSSLVPFALPALFTHPRLPRLQKRRAFL